MPANVLIIDDDREFRDVASKLLVAAGYGIAGAAATIAEARTAIADLRPDALLLDVNLPDGTGIDLAADLCVEQPALRILLTSSDDGSATTAALTGCGGAAFLAKTRLAVTDLVPFLGEP